VRHVSFQLRQMHERSIWTGLVRLIERVSRIVHSVQHGASRAPVTAQLECSGAAEVCGAPRCHSTRWSDSVQGGQPLRSAVRSGASPGRLWDDASRTISTSADEIPGQAASRDRQGHLFYTRRHFSSTPTDCHPSRWGRDFWLRRWMYRESVELRRRGITIDQTRGDVDAARCGLGAPQLLADASRFTRCSRASGVAPAT
jgi:hypothetical protein